MKYFHNICIITAHVLISTTCMAMDEKNKLENFTELTCVKLSQKALFLTNDRVVIRHQDGCSIVDVTTDTEVIKLNNNCTNHITVHPHKKTFALICGKKMIIYNAITGKKEWSKTNNNYSKSLIFSPHDETLLSVSQLRQGFDITKDNYVINGSITCNYQFYPTITFNPVQNEVCILQSTKSSQITQATLYPNIECPQTKQFTVELNNCDFCQYSPDGSFLAIGNNNSITTINVKEDTQEQSFSCHNTDEYIESLRDMQFYSNSVLAVASTIQYHSYGQQDHIRLHWHDICTNKSIQMNWLNQSDSFSFSESRTFTFSPDGTKIVLIVNDKCIIISVPWEIRRDGIKKEFSHLLFLLKNFNLDSSLTLPRELVTELSSTLLELFKR